MEYFGITNICLLVAPSIITLVGYHLPLNVPSPAYTAEDEIFAKAFDSRAAHSACRESTSCTTGAHIRLHRRACAPYAFNETHVPL